MERGGGEIGNAGRGDENNDGKQFGSFGRLSVLIGDLYCKT